MNELNGIQNNKALVTFLFISLGSLLFIGQLDIIERGSFKYFLILLPAIIFPFTRLSYIVCTFFIKTWPIFLMFLLTLVWGIYRHDLHSLNRILLFLVVLSWLELSDITLKVKTITKIYVYIVLGASLLYLCSTINGWALLPGGNGIWRVSFFPNIANTAFVSLFIFILCTKDKQTFMDNKFAACLSLYFIVFSFVRTAIISLIVYSVFQFCFKNIKSTKLLFLYSILMALFINVLVGYSIEIIHSLQSIPLLSRFLLRGQQGLSNHDIYVQMYRPWVWSNQWNIFINSPHLMGEGIYNFNDFISESLRAKGVEESDSVSMLLGLLASYGLPALLFYYYLLSKNFYNAMRLDVWASSIFPLIIFIGMQWGCVFHPASAIFVLFFLILIRGQKAFV